MDFLCLPDEDSSRQGRDHLRDWSSTRSPRPPQEMVWSHCLYLLPSSSVTFSYLWFCCHTIRYAATIKKIDYDKERVLVHYQQWSHRHNEWFQWNSSFLRPLERVSLRRQGLNPPYSHLVWHKNCMLTVILPSILTGGFICIYDLSELIVFFFCLHVSDVCFRYEGSGMLDGLSILPCQNPQR